MKTLRSSTPTKIVSCTSNNLQLATKQLCKCGPEVFVKQDKQKRVYDGVNKRHMKRHLITEKYDQKSR